MLWLFFFKGDVTSATSDGSVVQNSYDAIEGGGLMGKALGVQMVIISMELLRIWERQKFKHLCTNICTWFNACLEAKCEI